MKWDWVNTIQACKGTTPGKRGMSTKPGLYSRYGHGHYFLRCILRSSWAMSLGRRSRFVPSSAASGAPLSA